MSRRIAVLLPCFNEEITVAGVVRGFREALPEAEIYVYDNNSTDATASRAAEAGAVVRAEPRQGKGNVVRRMFADIDADIYVMADGDGTYDPGAATEMIGRLMDETLEMVVGARLESTTGTVFRRGHRLGNVTLTRFVCWLFGAHFTDILSGYRVFSRRFVKSFPALASGFEIETELTIHALDLKMPVAEVAAPYTARPEGSSSKLSTWSDGLRILATIVFLFKEVKPFKFFAAVCSVLALASLAVAYPLLGTYLETGLVPRLPTAVLATGIMLLASFSLACGIILDSVSRARRETKRLRLLSMAPVDRF
jgi:glycosyltransferase involved in cell wall biosynthesis